MADAATETKENTKKDEITGDDLVWDPKQQDYVSKTMSPALYRQQKAAQNRQAMAAAGVGLGAQAAQFAIGSTIFGDPAIKAQGQEKARLAAELRKGPDYQTETEKQARREAALAPVERKAEAVQRRAEAIAASTGDVSVRSLLAAGEAGIAQMRQQALEVEADIAAEDVRRQQIKADKDIQTRKSIEEIDAMMLELRNKYIREPLHKFISDAGKLAGTVMAYAPGKVIDDQVDRLRASGMEDEREIARFVRTFEGRPRAARKAADDLIAKRAPNVVEPTGDTGKTAEQEKVDAPPAPVPPTVWRDTSATAGSNWSKVEYTLQDDGNIVYTHPDGKRRMVRPGSKSYEAIMKIRPESGGEAGQQIARPVNLPTKEEFEAAQAKRELGTTVLQTEFIPMPDNKFRSRAEGDPAVQWDKENSSWIILDENLEPTDDDPLTLDTMKDSKPGDFEYKFYTLAKEAGLISEGTSA